MSAIEAVRVPEDGKGKRTEYDESIVGTKFTPVEWTITPEQIDYFCAGHQDYHASNALTFPSGGRIAPPLINDRPAWDMFSALYNVRQLPYPYESDPFFAHGAYKSLTRCPFSPHEKLLFKYA